MWDFTWPHSQRFDSLWHCGVPCFASLLQENVTSWDQDSQTEILVSISASIWVEQGLEVKFSSVMISSLWTYCLCHKLLVIVRFTLICQGSYLKSWNSHLNTRSDSCWRAAILANATPVQDNPERVLDVTPGWLGCISMCAGANCGGIKALCSSVLSFKGVRTYCLLFPFPFMWVLEEFGDGSSQLQKESCLWNLAGHLWVDHILIYVYMQFSCCFWSCEWPYSWDNLMCCLSKLG